MLKDLIQEYIEAYRKANLRDMLRIERDINALGMDSATLREKVKKSQAERRAS